MIFNRCRFVIFDWIRFSWLMTMLKKPTRKSRTSGDPLYLQIAGGLEKMISDEILKIGDKLPSVRIFSNERGVSMGTAFQAYYHLESKGLIEARPKSGYYVRFNMRRMPGLPRIADPEPVASEVSVQEMIATVYRNIGSDDLVNFSISAPPLSLLPAAKLKKSMLHALRNSRHQGVLYEDIQGNPELRRQLARHSFSWGGKFTAADVIVTAGCMEALVMCLKAITRPGDTVAVENPTFFGIFQVIESLGLKALELPTDPVTGIDPEQLDAAIRKFPIKACVFVPTFSNPLGSCMPDKKKAELVKLITRHRIPLIEDDIYGEMYFGAHRPRTCKSFDKEGWVLYCNSMSKSLAPGYRIGWTIPGRFTQQVLLTKLMHTVTGTTLTQEAVAHFLGIGRYEYHLKKLRKALHTQSLRYLQGIMTWFPPETKVSRPQGGFVLWIELPRQLNAYRLYQQALKHQVSVAPGQLFSARGQFGNCLRISYARPWDPEVEGAIRMLGALVKAHSRSKST
jgi:DNA-binding transcriptional MocR family regulator